MNALQIFLSLVGVFMLIVGTCSILFEDDPHEL